MKSEIRNRVIRFRTFMALFKEMYGFGILSTEDILTLTEYIIKTAGMKQVTIFIDDDLIVLFGQRKENRRL